MCKSPAVENFANYFICTRKKKKKKKKKKNRCYWNRLISSCTKQPTDPAPEEDLKESGYKDIKIPT